jgi:alkylhydroperoxidase family enzyme
VLTRVLANHPDIFARHLAAVADRQFDGLLGRRIIELARLRSAQLGGCAMCQAAKYGDHVSEADVQCMLLGVDDTLTEW